MITEYGKPVESTGNVTTTASEVLAANINRVGGLIQNQDADTVQISFTDNTAGVFFYNLAAGATLSLSGIKSAVYAVVGAGTARLYILELVA